MLQTFETNNSVESLVFSIFFLESEAAISLYDAIENRDNSSLIEF
jgi:hypothetical protein